MQERKYKIEDGRLVRRADGVPVPEDEPAEDLQFRAGFEAVEEGPDALEGVGAGEVRQGFECGVGVKGFDSFEEGDELECFIIEEVPV